MHLRIIPYKPGSESARKLAERLSAWLKYKVWRGEPKLKACNVSWGNKEPANVNWINSPPAVVRASNKLTTFQLLEAEGISHVPYTVSKEDAQAWLQKGFTVFARTVSGQSGSGITIVHPKSVLPNMPLYTQYVKKRKEFRAHVVAGKVIDVQQKKRRSGSQADNWICNLANGWVFCHEGIVEPDGLRDLAVRSVSALGLDFGAVDIIWNEHYNKCYVLEVNTAPVFVTLLVKGTQMQLHISLDKKLDMPGMAEVGQVNPSKFAFALVEGDTVFPLHTAIKCRDFLNDTLVWLEEGFTSSIYGYKYHGPIDMEHTTFHLTFCQQVPENISKLNEFEVALGLEPTTLLAVEDGSLVSRGDKWWMSSTLHSSWYTQALRHCNYTLDKLQDASQEHLINNLNGRYWLIPAALRKLALTIVRNGPSLNSTMHDLNGFYTMLTSNKSLRPQLTYGKQLDEQSPELFHAP